MTIFISAGEPSGDLHAANLMEALRMRIPDAEFVGFGGPKMSAGGARLLYPLVNLAVMWFLNVLLNIITFIRLIMLADRFFRDQKPDALVLVDYPGLHWWLARRARRAACPCSITFLPRSGPGPAGVSRKSSAMWTWCCAACRSSPPGTTRGVPQAEYVGHPYFDELSERELDETFMESMKSQCAGRPLVAILPGSRTQELTRNLPIMVRAAARLARARPDTRFAVACLHERHRELAEQVIRAAGLQSEDSTAPRIEVFAARTGELIRLADAAWAVSGSVSLELMMDALPTVILYKLNRFDLWIARPFIKARYITLVNLLADAELMPEYLTVHDVSGELAQWAQTWLDDPLARARTTANLAALRHRVARPGASQRAAESIVAWLNSQGGRKAVYRGPHEAGAREHEALELPELTD